MAGSPPRGWGKLGIQIALDPVGRFTPTRVGKTPSRRVVSERPSVHPHAGGENDDLSRTGTQPTRFTPTRVGKTCQSATEVCVLPVHPHAGGENAWPVHSVHLWGAVHPHAGGENFSAGLRFCQVERFTPTRVGKTMRLVTARPGVNGSPPRGWGKRRPPHEHPRPGRFTPTRVGKTGRGITGGECERFTPTRAGKTLQAEPHPQTTRFTPTRVGKTVESQARIR